MYVELLNYFILNALINALPHPSIPSSELYKHISPDLPDPVKMKQVLVWCGQRAIEIPIGMFSC